jgi:hypothetical protein
MAMVLLLLIVYGYTKRQGFFVAAIVLHVLNMTAPKAFRQVAVAWLGFSHLLGTVMSKIVLSIVFFLVVSPVAIIRRLMGKDAMRLRAFKAGDDSVMVRRDHAFVASDIERPY